MQIKQIKKWFLLVMLAFAVSSASVILVPFSIGKDGNLNAAGYVSGAMFWAGLLLGIGGYVLLSKKADIRTEDAKEKKIPNLLRFFSNPPAKVMDGILIIGLAGTAYCAINITVTQILAVLFLVFTVAGIYAHILLNGKIYRYIWTIQKNTEDTEIHSAISENEGGM